MQKYCHQLELHESHSSTPYPQQLNHIVGREGVQAGGWLI
jgi:hypothetical protein